MSRYLFNREEGRQERAKREAELSCGLGALALLRFPTSIIRTWVWVVLGEGGVTLGRVLSAAAIMMGS